MSEHDIENPPNETNDSSGEESIHSIEHEDIDDEYSQQMDNKLSELRNALKDVITTSDNIDVIHDSDSPLTISYHNSDDEGNEHAFHYSASPSSGTPSFTVRKALASSWVMNRISPMKIVLSISQIGVSVRVGLTVPRVKSRASVRQM